MKKCKACNEEKALSEFYRRSGGRQGVQTMCKPCHKARGAELREQRKAADPEAFDRKWRESQYRRLYGIGVDDYERMSAEQGGVCAICGSADPKRAADSVFSVDHDHETGAVRGLLCHDCNTALGKFGDSIETLLAAVDYLKRAQS
jgi:hypothetical protein